MYVGSRKRYKNFRFFIESFSSIEDIKKNFDIVCFGGGPFLKEEKKLFYDMKLTLEQVKFFDGSDILLKNLYQNAEALIYPSIYEGFGLPVLEAMENNCAVVCSNTSSLPEIYGNAALTFNPILKENLIDCIKKIVYENDLKKDIKKKGLQRAKFFSWNKSASEHIQAYKELLWKKNEKHWFLVALGKMFLT